MSKELNKWFDSYKYISQTDRFLVTEKIKQFSINPKISLITTAYNTKPDWVIECLQSLKQQLYSNWEWCVCDNGSTKYNLTQVLAKYLDDPRIKLVRVEPNRGISGGTNAALELATGDYCGMLDSDDYLSEVALYLIADTVNKHPDANYIYTDQVHVTADKTFEGAYFKPDFSPHLICSQNYITHFSVYRSEIIKPLKFRSERDGSQDYDMTLRVIDSVPHNTIYHIPYLAYFFRRHPSSMGTSRESYAILAAIKALKDHIQRLGREADVVLHWPWYRVKYKLPNPAPSVDIVLVSGNKNNILLNCINKILSKTIYPNYAFYICAPETQRKVIESRYGALVDNGKIKFVHRADDEPFNYSTFANRTVKECQSSIICLLNDDVEPIEDNWLEEMVSYAIHPEVGCVGAKLMYGNMTTQHAGVVLGICSDICNHAFKGQHFNYDGYYGKNRLIGNWSAVTGACSVMRKEVYEQVGGYEEELAVAYADVDFCLKLIKAGYYNVLNPYALLFHHEAFTRGPDQTKEQIQRFAKEIEWMKKKWGRLLKEDPFYSPELSLDSINFDLAPVSRYQKPWLN